MDRNAGPAGRPLPKPPIPISPLANEHPAEDETEDAEEMRAIAKLHGISDDVMALEERLKEKKVTFTATPGENGPSARLIHGLLNQLPERFWSTDPVGQEKGLALKQFQLGGRAGNLEPNGGSYVAQQEKIHICENAMAQHPNVLLRIVCHELGHAFFETYLKANQLGTLKDAHGKICEARTLFAVEIGGIGTAEERKEYQSQIFGEFLAEVFMHYVLDQTAFSRMVKSRAGYPDGQAWQSVYEALHEALGTINSDEIWSALGLDPSGSTSS